MSMNRVSVSQAAFIVHRISGIVLACFLPFHFLVLGLALEDGAALDTALVFTETPIIKLGEWGIVVLLSAHLTLGLRVLVIEWMPWPKQGGLRLGWVAIAVVVALVVGAVFIGVSA